MRVDAFGCVNKRRRVGEEGKLTENEAEEKEEDFN